MPRLHPDSAAVHQAADPAHIYQVATRLQGEWRRPRTLQSEKHKAAAEAYAHALALLLMTRLDVTRRWLEENDA